MITTDFSNQKYPVLAGLAVFLGTLMILLIPSNKFIKLYTTSTSASFSINPSISTPNNIENKFPELIAQR